ncbi:hypothetical protein GGF31_004317 [Allomyces arbusculus]|nr:hypothetical protein GGF31_004317 [Allomyces arbusculus]
MAQQAAPASSESLAGLLDQLQLDLAGLSPLGPPAPQLPDPAQQQEQDPPPTRSRSLPQNQQQQQQDDAHPHARPIEAHDLSALGDLAALAAELDAMLATGRASKRLSTLLMPSLPPSAAPSSSSLSYGTPWSHRTDSPRALSPIPAGASPRSRSRPPSANSNPALFLGRRTRSLDDDKYDDDDHAADNVPLHLHLASPLQVPQLPPLQLPHFIPLRGGTDSPAEEETPRASKRRSAARAAADDDEDEDAPLAATLVRQRSLNHGATLTRSQSARATPPPPPLPFVDDEGMAAAAAAATSGGNLSRNNSTSRHGTSSLSRAPSRKKSTRRAAAANATPVEPVPTNVQRTLEKLALAQVHKVPARIHVHSAHVQTYLDVTLTSLMTAEQVVTAVLTQLNLPPTAVIPNDVEGAGADGDWVLFEVYNDLGVERPLRDWEPVASVLKTWEPETTNALVVRPYLYRASLSAEALNVVFPPMRDSLYTDSKRTGVWKKRFVEVKYGIELHSTAVAGFDGSGSGTAGTLTGAIAAAEVAAQQANLTSTDAVASVYSSSSSSKPTALVCSLAHFDVYMATPARAATAKAIHKKYHHVLALKSQQRFGLFEDTSGFMFVFAAPSQESLREWLFCLRNAKAHVDKFLHPEWFDEAPMTNPVAAGAVPMGTSGQQVQAAVQIPQGPQLTGLVGGLVGPTAPPSGLPVSTTAPTNHPTGPIIPVMAGSAPVTGKPLLDFQGEEPSVVRARSTLARSRTMASRTRDANRHGADSSAPAGRAYATLGRMGSTRAPPPPLVTPDDDLAAAADEYPHRMYASDTPGATDDDDEGAPVGATLARNRSQHLARSGTIARTRARSRSRHRAALDAEPTGGPGTLLDRIDRRREQQAAPIMSEPASYAAGGAMPKRSLIEMIPKSRW